MKLNDLLTTTDLGFVPLTTVASSLGVRRFRIIVTERWKKSNTFGIRELGRFRNIPYSEQHCPCPLWILQWMGGCGHCWKLLIKVVC